IHFLKRRPRVSSSKVGSSIPSSASRVASRGMPRIKRLISAQLAKPPTAGIFLANQPTASLTGVGLPQGVAPTGYCYMVGNSVLIPNAFQAFGTMGRNIFRDTGFHNVDLSVSKSFRFGERMKAQFRVETFNIFNHPNFANPNGGTSTYGQGATADPSQAGAFGCGCSTPDNAAFNPVLGSGSNRAIQLGLKFIF